MLFLKMLFLLFQVCLLFNRAYSQSAENFFVESASWCENITDPSVKMYVDLKNSTNGKQIVDANFSTTSDIGDNVWAIIIIEQSFKTVESGDDWIKLFTIKESYCKALKTYMGEFVYDIQRAAAVIPSSCPTRKGNYHLTNYQPNFRKLKLQAVPYGRLRFTMKLQDKQSLELLSCVIVTIRNFPSKN